MLCLPASVVINLVPFQLSKLDDRLQRPGNQQAASMDFKGQKLAEQLTLYLLVATAVVSFCSGYLLQDFGLFVKAYFAGTAVTLLAVVPDWPFYNRNGLLWLDPATRRSSKKIAKH